MRRQTAVLILVLTACARNDADELLEQLEADDYRNTYARAPGWEQALAPSTAPHGEFVDIYVNDVVADALASGDSLSAWPEGSIIVKDGWEDEAGATLRYIAIMEKRGPGQWFWAEYEPDGSVAFAGLDEPTCTGCHASGADQVLAFELP